MLTVNSTEIPHTACLAVIRMYSDAAHCCTGGVTRAGTPIEILPHIAPLHCRQTLHYPHRRNLSRRVHLFMAWLTETIKEAAE